MTTAAADAAAAADVQYRVVVAKGDERVAGDPDARVVLTVPLAVAAAEDFDPAVAFMRGDLKASGHTGVLIDVLTSGAAAAAIAELV
jgi:hypothetical protein